jgi:hypothetical protein
VRSNLTVATNIGLLGVPLQTVRICPTASFAPEPAAAFISTIAYPLVQEVEDRDRFRYALCRWAIDSRSKKDREWATQPQILKPRAFLYLNAEWPKIIEHGFEKVSERVAATQLIVLPHYIALRTGTKPKSVIPGYEPNSKDMSLFCINKRDALRGKDVNANPADADPGNFSKRQWKPTLVVAHAVLGLLSFHSKLAGRRHDRKKNSVQEKRKEEKDLAPNVMYCLHSPTSMQEIVISSEVIRQQLASIKKLKIKEDRTVAFYFDLGGCRAECGWNFSGAAQCNCDALLKPIPIREAISRFKVFPQ